MELMIHSFRNPAPTASKARTGTTMQQYVLMKTPEAGPSLRGLLSFLPEPIMILPIGFI